MAWLRERVWQLGIAVVTVLVGTIVLYLGASANDTALTWLGLALVFAAMVIPLASRVYQSAAEGAGEKGET